MATAKLHALIQTRKMKDPEEGAYLLYFMNRIVQKTIEGNNLCVISPASSFGMMFEIGHTCFPLPTCSVMFTVDNQEHYSFLIPVVKALLEKLSITYGLATHLPGLPQTQAGPSFFDDFQSYCQEAQWKMFMEKKVGQL